MSTTTFTERLVLRVLADLGGHMIAEPKLLTPVNDLSATPVTRDDLRQILRTLDGKHQVIGITGDDYTKWKISANGLARLAEANL